MVEFAAADALKRLYLATSFEKTEKLTNGYAPVNARFADPVTISPGTTPVIENVPVEFEEAVVMVPRVTAEMVVLPNAACKMLGPEDPILRVPVVSLFDTVEFVTVSDVATNVPIVAVPVDAVIFDPNVIAPS